jgi:uncharacterized protein HemX
MKYLLVVIFLAFILLGNTPTSGNPSHDSSHYANAYQPPAAQAPTAENKKDSGRDSKPDQPEAPSDKPTEPHVTINAVPGIDVKRDWIDYATLIVGMLLVIVAAITGGVVWYQAVQTKIAAQAGRASAKAALLNAQSSHQFRAPMAFG